MRNLVMRRLMYLNQTNYNELRLYETNFSGSEMLFLAKLACVSPSKHRSVERVTISGKL